MSSSKHIISVEIDFEILKDYHPLLGAWHGFLIKKPNINIHKVQDKISYTHMQPSYFKGVEDDLKRLFKVEFELKEWRRHRDHCLFLADLIIRDEYANNDFKKQRILQLKEIVGNIGKLNKILTSSKGVRTLTVNGINIDSSHISNKAVKVIQDELIALYNEHILDSSLPKMTDNNIAEVVKIIRKPKLKTINAYDKTVGYLSLALKIYLEDQANMKGGDSLIIFKRDKTIELSNEQGTFIYQFLRILNIIPHKKTAPHIIIRRYIEKYTDDIDFHNNAFQNRSTK